MPSCASNSRAPRLWSWPLRCVSLQLGVKEVWLVDLDLRQIFVSGRDGHRDTPHDSELTWRSPGGRVLTLDIPALFRGLPK
jgi:hypothetical protein